MHYRKHILASIFCLTIIYSACEAQYDHIAFDHYNTKNGLSNNEVNDIIQDDDGFIWIATRSGLNRFDGKDFTKHFADGSNAQLPSSDIYRIARFTNGRILIGTLKGIAVLNTRTGIMNQLVLPGDSSLKKYRNRILDIVVDSDRNVIVASLSGVFVFDSTLKIIFHYEPFTESDLGKKRIEFCYSVHLLKNGKIFIPATTDIYLLDLKTKILKSVSQLAGSDWNLFRNWRTSGHLLIDWKDNDHCFLINYITVRDSLNLYELDFAHHQIHSLNIPISQKNEIHWKTNILFLNDSVLGLNSSYQNGIYIFRLNSAKNSLVYSGKWLNGVQCNRIFMDREKRLWISTDDGVFKQSFQKSIFHNVYVPSIDKKHNIDNYVNGFAVSGNKLFVSIFATGILRYNLTGKSLSESGQKIITGINLPWNIVQTETNRLLITTQQGAVILNTENERSARFWKAGMVSSLDEVAITSTLLDSHGNLWMGLGNGLGVFRMNVRNHTTRVYSSSGGNYPFPIRYPVTMAEDQKGDIWMSGIEGITRWNEDKQRFDTLIKHIPGLPDDISGQWISVTADKSGNLWICPEEFFLIKWNLASGKIKIFHPTAVAGALRTHQLQGPWNGILWMPTNAGLLSFDIKTEKFNILTEEDGLPGDNALDGRIYFDSLAGRIYAGFDRSFTWFEPEKLVRPKHSPNTYITDVRSIGDSISRAGQYQAEFPHNRNSISISFTGINFDNGQSNQYAYRLFENHPSDWIFTGQQKTINFANLKPGNYTFQVKTINNDEAGNAGMATMALDIIPAYYQTGWFYALCFIILLAILYALYRYRIQQLIRVQKVRNNISSDLHDDIGARLTNMNILTMLSEQNLGKPEISGKYLSRIAGEIQSSGQALDDIVWSINSHHDSITDTIARMRRYAAEQFEPTHISFDFKSEFSNMHHKLLMDQRRDLFLVYKEAITNIQKHSGATQVSIRIGNVKKELTLSITDNGKGFDSTAPTHRNGLTNMHTRIQKWQGILTVASTPGVGTVISIRLP